MAQAIYLSGRKVKIEESSIGSGLVLRLYTNNEYGDDAIRVCLENVSRLDLLLAVSAARPKDEDLSDQLSDEVPF